MERHSQYLFDENLFLFFDYLQKFNPGLSTSGFLHSLEQFSAEKKTGSVATIISTVDTIKAVNVLCKMRFYTAYVVTVVKYSHSHYTTKF